MDRGLPTCGKLAQWRTSWKPSLARRAGDLRETTPDLPKSYSRTSLSLRLETSAPRAWPECILATACGSPVWSPWCTRAAVHAALSRLAVVCIAPADAHLSLSQTSADGSPELVQGPWLLPSLARTRRWARSCPATVADDRCAAQCRADTQTHAPASALCTDIVLPRPRPSCQPAQRSAVGSSIASSSLPAARWACAAAPPAPPLAAA